MPTYEGGPYLQASFDDILSSNVIGPLNIPYSRTNESLNDVVNMLYTNLVPWELWIDYNGKVHMGVKKGSDKSADIILEAGGRLNKVNAERTTKQTAQRIRVTGQGESKTQDDVTSDWKEDSDTMTEINTFYEKIQGEREISNKSIADIEAQILLVAQAPVREEITLPDVDFSPYTADDVDVGDYVTATDPVSGLSGSCRIKTIEKTVSDSGEVVNVTVTKMRTDITDRLARLQKKLDELQTSNTALEKLLDTGGKQGNINPDKLENVWQITASNKLLYEVPEESTEGVDDPNITFSEAAGGGTYDCSKDEFYLNCDTVGADDIRLYSILRELDFEDDSRFSCEVRLEPDSVSWATNDLILFGIWNTTLDRGFGFRLQKNNTGTFDCDIVLADGVVALQYVGIEAITGSIEAEDTLRFEARIDWDEKIVRYYFGSSSRDFAIIGILPISLAASATGQQLKPFFVRLVEAGATNNDIMGVFNNWRTQAKALYVT